jgi:hypothetical protein
MAEKTGAAGGARDVMLDLHTTTKRCPTSTFIAISGPWSRVGGGDENGRRDHLG